MSTIKRALLATGVVALAVVCGAVPAAGLAPEPPASLDATASSASPSSVVQDDGIAPASASVDLSAPAAPVAPKAPVAPEAPVAPTASVASAGNVPADTEVWLETVAPLSSATLKRGDGFALRVAEPVMVNGVVVVPAGAACHGEVIHADRSRGGGRAGELLLAARYIEHDGRRIGLRGFRIAATGRQRMGATVGVALVGGPLALFVRGTEIEIPAGTSAQARVAAAVAQPVSPATAPKVSQPSASADRPASGEVVQ